MIMSKILVTLPENLKYFTTAWESVQKGERKLANLIAQLLTEESRNKTDKEVTVAFQISEKKMLQM